MRRKNKQLILSEKENEENQIKQYSKPMGGFLPFPPKECLRPDFIRVFTEKHVPWIDLSICIDCPQKCLRRKEYLQQMKEERNANRKPEHE